MVIFGDTDGAGAAAAKPALPATVIQHPPKKRKTMPPDNPEIQITRCQYPFFQRARQDFRYHVYYSRLNGPSGNLGRTGDLFVLESPPTIFWKEDRWRPWTWGSRVHCVELRLNFDLKGPVWHPISSKTATPSFEYMETAVCHFFTTVKNKSDLGTVIKPIIIV